jgi:hypothetical protein
MILTALLLAHSASAGPAAYGIYQAGCAALVTACYTAAGFTWGATMGVSVPATIIACNSAFGICDTKGVVVRMGEGGGIREGRNGAGVK